MGIVNFLFEGIHRLFGRTKENHGTHSGKEDSEVWKVLTQTMYLIYYQAWQITP